jgi:hypothetical protein
MKLAPRLRLAPRRSLIGCALITAACALTSLLLALLPLPLAACLAGAVVILAVLALGLWRCTRRGVPSLFHVGIDLRITVTDCDGRSRAGSILDDSYVGACMTTIIWRADGDPWWQPARSILVLPDTLPRDEFRRLRVVLRYGSPVVEGETNGAEAG